jgi:Flp pilus assembly protein TadG
MRLNTSRTRTHRRAVASVELAILLPFLFFLFVIAVDYGRVFYFANTLENCSRNGAYYVSDYPNSNYIYNNIYGYSSLNDAVLRDASDVRDPNNPANDPTYTVGYGTNPNGPFTNATQSPDCYAQVTVYWTFNSITNFPGVPSQVYLARSTVMRVAPAMPVFN